jgi:hypothetical protein
MENGVRLPLGFVARIRDRCFVPGASGRALVFLSSISEIALHSTATCDLCTTAFKFSGLSQDFFGKANLESRASKSSRYFLSS